MWPATWRFRFFQRLRGEGHFVEVSGVQEVSLFLGFLIYFCSPKDPGKHPEKGLFPTFLFFSDGIGALIPCVFLSYTIPETNIAPDNGFLQKETSLPAIHLQVLWRVGFKGRVPGVSKRG